MEELIKMQSTQQTNAEIVTDRLIQQSYRNEFHNRYDFMAPNIFVDGGQFECDLIGLRPSGFMDEIEMNCNVSDYKADFKKNSRFGGWWDSANQRSVNPRGYKHEQIQAGRLLCNYFSFLVPIDMVKKIDVPDYCGLYGWHQPRKGFFYLKIETIKKGPKLHNEKRVNERLKYLILLKVNHRFWNI